MVIGPHAATSMLITTLLERSHTKSSQKNKLVLLVSVTMFSFASHFLLDKIPHSEYTLSINNPEDTYKLTLDILSALAAFFVIFWPRVKTIVSPLQYDTKRSEPILPRKISFSPILFLAIWLGVFFACLPDIIIRVFYPTSNLFLKNFSKFHAFFHASKTSDVWIGYCIQTIIYLVVVFWARYLAKNNYTEQIAEWAGREYIKCFSGKRGDK